MSSSRIIKFAIVNTVLFATSIGLAQTPTVTPAQTITNPLFDQKVGDNNTNDFVLGDVKADVTAKRNEFAQQFQSAYQRSTAVEREQINNQFEDAFRQTQGTDADDLPIVDIPTGISSLDINRDLNSDSLSMDGAAAKNTGNTPGDLPVLTSSGYSNAEPVMENLIWWPQLVVAPLHAANQVAPTNPDQLLHQALQNSPRIQAISNDPLISDLQVIEQDAVFDPEFFARSLYDDRVDPVGNSLTTGGAPFLEDNIWSGEAGFRRKLRRGGDIDISQTFGFQNSNSQFFVPQDQGTATLAINYSQPVLRGRGAYINSAQILIAQSSGGVSWDTFSAELQREIENILSAYWQLYFDRSVFLQKKQNVDRGQKILKTLIDRKDLDSLPSQIARARASVESRKTELANAFRDVRNAETTLRQLVGQRNWQAGQNVELLPVKHPFVAEFGIPIEQVIYTALDNRPEIRAAVRRTKIAAVQRDISENEILPDLSLLFGTYVSALRDDSGVFRAFQDQFAASTPGFSFGLEYEVPVRRRASRSRFAQTKLQFAKLQSELDEEIQRVIAESQIAHRRVQSALQTLKAAYTSIEAAAADLRQQQKRWETFALIEGDVGEGRTPTTVLDQLLDSQERLNSTELVYSQALLELQVSVVSLNRVSGRLLMHENVSFHKSTDGWVPNLRLDRFTTPSYGPQPNQVIQEQPIQGAIIQGPIEGQIFQGPIDGPIEGPILNAPTIQESGISTQALPPVSFPSQ